MDLRVYRSAPERAAIVLAHGAGAGQLSPFMASVARGFATRGIAAATFDFPYMHARRRVPDSPAVLEREWREAIEAARNEFGALPLFVGGKSMGGRIASHVAADATHVPLAGLVFLGYPLHPPGKPHQRRDAHLPSIAEPMLFVQGTRDAFGSAQEIRDLLPSLQHASLCEVDGGDHSFKVPAGARLAPPDLLDGLLDYVVNWMRLTIERRA